MERGLDWFYRIHMQAVAHRSSMRVALYFSRLDKGLLSVIGIVTVHTVLFGQVVRAFCSSTVITWGLPRL
jgi:hypothetical protein